jgi:hypothetical protein
MLVSFFSSMIAMIYMRHISKLIACKEKNSFFDNFDFNISINFLPIPFRTPKNSNYEVSELYKGRNKVVLFFWLMILFSFFLSFFL